MIGKDISHVYAYCFMLIYLLLNQILDTVRQFKQICDSDAFNY